MLASGEIARWIDPQEPVICSLLDIEFYKILVSQFAFFRHRERSVKFEVLDKNKSVLCRSVLPSAIVDFHLASLQLLCFSKEEILWLSKLENGRGLRVFSEEYLLFLSRTSLSDYEVTVSRNEYGLVFSGPWFLTTLWESYVLSVLRELYSRFVVRSLGETQRTSIFELGDARNLEKFKDLGRYPGIKIADFSVRRRFSGFWQRRCLQSMQEISASHFCGTSNAMLARKEGLKVLGTLPHEVSMIYMALACNSEEIVTSLFESFNDWQAYYGDYCCHILPDTVSISSFFRSAPSSFASWETVRLDSGEPEAEIERVLEWWCKLGQDISRKVIILSDSLRIKETIRIFNKFSHRVNLEFAWGSHFSNDFDELFGSATSAPYSVVCKPVSVDGRPTVKISDNYSKSVGPTSLIKLYRSIWDLD